MYTTHDPPQTVIWGGRWGCSPGGGKEESAARGRLGEGEGKE